MVTSGAIEQLHLHGKMDDLILPGVHLCASTICHHFIIDGLKIDIDLDNCAISILSRLLLDRFVVISDDLGLGAHIISDI